MRRPIVILLAIMATLASVEALAWWWMNQPPAGGGETVLAFRPTVGLALRAGRDSANGAESERAEIVDCRSKIVDDLSSSPNQISTIPNPQSPISPTSIQHSSFNIPNFPSITPLPESYRQDAPMLRCSDGEVFRVDTPENLSLHLAWFEWNDTDTGSVLEAFRHMPEACLGSIGMKLVSKEKPIRFQVGLDRRAGSDSVSGQESQRAEIVDHGSKIADVPSSSSNPQSAIPNPQSPISLTFDHTIFEEPGGSNSPLRTPVHSFRAVWVSGIHEADARHGVRGDELDRLRAIRLKSAIERYRPRHARVIQGTIRGALNTADAWQAFEQHMLRHLTLERLQASGKRKALSCERKAL